MIDIKNLTLKYINDMNITAKFNLFKLLNSTTSQLYKYYLDKNKKIHLPYIDMMVEIIDKINDDIKEYIKQGKTLHISIGNSPVKLIKMHELLYPDINSTYIYIPVSGITELNDETLSKIHNLIIDYKLLPDNINDEYNTIILYDYVGKGTSLSIFDNYFTKIFKKPITIKLNNYFDYIDSLSTNLRIYLTENDLARCIKKNAIDNLDTNISTISETQNMCTAEILLIYLYIKQNNTFSTLFNMAANNWSRYELTSLIDIYDK